MLTPDIRWMMGSGFFFTLLESKSRIDLPQAHLWYSNREVFNALKLFLAAGNGLAGSLTYRLIIFSYSLLFKIINKIKILKQLLMSNTALSVQHTTLANMLLFLPVE